MLDLLVIGAGLSGLTAALVVAKAGKRVRVVAKGMGTTHWHAGTIDWLGYMPGSGAPVDDPLSQTDSLPIRHPYKRIGANKISASLAAFRENLADAGLSYRMANSGHTNLWLPSAVGAARPTYLAPTAQATGTLASAEPMVVVGFQGMRDFYPHLIAENLSQQGHVCRAELLPLSTITRRVDSNTVQLASFLEDRDRQEALGAALGKCVRSGERIGLPAILGIDTHAECLESLQQAAGAPIFEIPTLPPSVPGIRLHRVLVHQLKALGVRVEIGMSAIAFSEEERLIQWVETETSSRPLKHRAANFLLATGGILGGGFTSNADGQMWEVVFQLPLTTPQGRSGWFQAEFLDQRGHPVYLGGVSMDDCFQPIDASGAIAYTNLWAAGGCLAHTDPIRERSLEGLAIATGFGAAQTILDSRF